MNRRAEDGSHDSGRSPLAGYSGDSPAGPTTPINPFNAPAGGGFLPMVGQRVNPLAPGVILDPAEAAASLGGPAAAAAIRSATATPASHTVLSPSPLIATAPHATGDGGTTTWYSTSLASSNNPQQASSVSPPQIASRTTGSVMRSPSPYASAMHSSPPIQSPPPSNIYASGNPNMSTVYVSDLASSTMLRRADSKVIDSSQLTAEHHFISEALYENEVRVPKRVVREEIREKTIVVPETVQIEEVVEEIIKVKEKIIEIAKPVYQEKIVEVPQIEYVEKVVEVPEYVIQERIVEVPRVEVVERVSRVPKVVVKEEIVPVLEYEYREVEVEKIVEVPEIREEVIYKEIPVDHVVEVPVPEYHTIEVPQDIDRYLPVPVEAITFYEFRLPKMSAKYNKKPYPIYVPRFVEVPIPTPSVDEANLSEMTFLHENVQSLCANPCPNLCEVEKLAEYAKTRNFTFHPSEALLQQKFLEGKL